jgi:hypothetical protein
MVEKRALPGWPEKTPEKKHVIAKGNDDIARNDPRHVKPVDLYKKQISMKVSKCNQPHALQCKT